MKKLKQTKSSPIIVNVLIITMIAALYFSTSISTPVFGASTDVFYSPPVYRGSKKNTAAIMVEVDYSASKLEDILKTLSKSDTQITFAVSGKWARDNATYLKQMVNDGHEIAVMGYEIEKDGELEWVINDVENSLDTVELICGVRPALYYSGEKRNIPVSAYAAEELGVTHVLCTVDMLCAKGGSEDIISRAKKLSDSSSIILAQPTKAMSESLLEVIKILKSKGLVVTTVSDII